MQDAELFLSLAEIAGVFVGFGALIAIRGGGVTEDYDVASVGMVVWGGITVVFVALVPVALSRFDIPGHALWLACSLIVLALFWIGNEVVQRVSRELRALKTVYTHRTRVWVELAGTAFWAPMTAALVAIVLGLFPDQEPALYLASVVLLLFMDAWLLLLLVFSVGRPQAVSDQAPLPVTGGSSA
ncbi:MAG: hypothetical protein ACYC65_12240 [Candidatus Limnocylindrales bacterium]